jgi:hypothetical protein
VGSRHHDGACNSTGSGTVLSSTYDEADRATKSGYAFDAFGRITQVPAEDASDQQMTLTYFENDRLDSVTAGGVTSALSIDPLNRVRVLQAGSSLQTHHYHLDADVPAWISEDAAGATWTRNAVGPNGLLVAVTDQAGDATLQVTNLHEDVVATVDDDPTSLGLVAAQDFTEFGVPRSPGTNRYGWTGGYQRSTEATTGSIFVGARVYLLSLGRLLQVDPIIGGSANASISMARAASCTLEHVSELYELLRPAR